MDAGRYWYAASATTVLVAALVVALGTGLVPLPDDGGTTGTPSDCGVTTTPVGGATTTPVGGATTTPVGGAAGPPDDEARVTVLDENGTVLATISAVVADTPDERFTGLSDTESLADGEGMLFVFEREETRHFVMRRMDFPLDMMFVGANRSITVVHHAALRENQPPDAEPFSGRAQWVIEVPRGYANETGIAAGDCIRIDYAGTGTPTDGGNRTG